MSEMVQHLRFCGVLCIARSVSHTAKLTCCFSAVAELLVHFGRTSQFTKNLLRFSFVLSFTSSSFLFYFVAPCASRLNWQFSVSFQAHVKSSSSYSEKSSQHHLYWHLYWHLRHALCQFSVHIAGLATLAERRTKLSRKFFHSFIHPAYITCSLLPAILHFSRV